MSTLLLREDDLSVDLDPNTLLRNIKWENHNGLGRWHQGFTKPALYTLASLQQPRVSWSELRIKHLSSLQINSINHGKSRGRSIGGITKLRLIRLRFRAGIPGPTSDETAIIEFLRDGTWQKAQAIPPGYYGPSIIKDSRPGDTEQNYTQSKVDPNLKYPPMFVFGYYDNGFIDGDFDDSQSSLEEALKLAPKDPDDLQHGTPVVYELRIVAEGVPTIQFELLDS
jgi:hypothetical protein